ncbi:beta-lactamase/transpeptidase-like protein [Aspergillus terreus]|uniref:Beta-lactamase/transpeptidase-like protein n=1 Tax=Aspergillus terreus TaxID=33178 RepID=A0A5M3YTN9_ASPTE|nr:hypothetical protein ATETN484_0002041700 [Aspergillus terreus]GFF15273.1 beta-lactamase/transpeptidase-like protein [Aspergillus terreus]
MNRSPDAVIPNSNPFEVGASLCVNRDGTNIIDLWGGYTNEQKSTEWTCDILVPLWSASKLVTNFATLMLVDRGLLDLNANLSSCWPEFAANGKENIKVRHVLSHATGLGNSEVSRAGALVGARDSFWVPYRIAGSFKRFIKGEIADPLGADFQLGALEKDRPRIAKVVPPLPMSLSGLEEGSVASKSLKSAPFQSTDTVTPEFRHA